MGQFFDKNAVVGQGVADGVEIGHLGLQTGLLSGHCLLERGHFLLAGGAAAVVAAQRVDQRGQPVCAVYHQPNSGRRDAVVLFRVDVDADDLQLLVHAPLEQGKGHPAAHNDNGVGLGPEAVGHRQGEAEMVAAAEDAPPVVGGKDRSLQGFGQGADLFPGVLRAAAHENEGMLGAAKNPRGPVDGVRVHSGATHGQGQGGQAHLRLAGEHIQGHFQAYRAGPIREHFAQGHCQQPLGFLGAGDTGGPFGQGTDDRHLVGDFVEHPVAPANLVRMNLAGEGQDFGVAAVGGGEGGGGVEQPRPGHDVIDTHPVARQGIAQGHIGRALLVAAMDHPEFLPRVVDGVVEVVILHAGQAENRVHAVGDQPGDESFSAGVGGGWGEIGHGAAPVG